MISMDKKYRTRGSWPVTLYCNDAPGFYPVHGRIVLDGEQLPTAWKADGEHCSDDRRLDLIEVQPELTQAYEWVPKSKNKYKYLQLIGEYESEAAARAAHPDAAVIVKVPG